MLKLIEVCVDQFRASGGFDERGWYLLIEAESWLTHPFKSAHFGPQNCKPGWVRRSPLGPTNPCFPRFAMVDALGLEPRTR